jgi:endonuclease/exonuclease/phosphatase family metal-dependent hydrolase
MKFILSMLFAVFVLQVAAQSGFEICSWNIANFGKSKTEEEIKFIAELMKKYDVVAIVEVVAGKGGPEAVAALKKELNRSTVKWDYELSLPTTSTMNGSERYAVFWKIARLERVGVASLEKIFQKQIDREPFMVGFKVPGGQTFTVAAFHAVPTNKNPAKEIKLLHKIPAAYPQKNIIFCGDFNLTGTDEAYDAIKAKGYATALVDQKTSLRQQCDTSDDMVEDDEECLASVYDNFLYRTDKQELKKSGVIKFYEEFTDYKKARKLSDHIPIVAKFNLN